MSRPSELTLPASDSERQIFERIQAVLKWLNERIIGQEYLTQRLVMSLLCGGHLLVEGAPGLAKTRAIKELAKTIKGEFHRIQFTPDLLPSDVTGTEIFRPEDASFYFQKGPIFHNLLLADEVNRAPAKVQSALLEAMAEHQVTFGRDTYSLPDLFLVMATQNPIEQEGTYPLPEAQLDRFLMHVKVDYPASDAERAIMHMVRREVIEVDGPYDSPVPESDIFTARRQISGLYMADAVEKYIVNLVVYTRDSIEDLAYGASPRATIALDICARANAWLDHREYVSPEDVQAVLHDVMRHRLILTFDAEARGIETDDIIDTLIETVVVP